MADNVHVQNPLILDDLYAAFEAADNIVLKKYVTKLSEAPCIEMSEELKSINIGENVSLYRVAKIIYDKNENVQDKLTTVYSTVFSLDNCGVVMLLNGYKEYIDLFLGVVTRNLITQLNNNDELAYLSVIDKNLIESGKVLRNAFLGNFPGTELRPVNNITIEYVDGHPSDSMGKKDIIQDVFRNTKYISAVSSIPAIRNSNEYKNHEFVQGLEKFIDTLKGKEYAAIIIADAMSNSKIEEICAEYEDIYSQLAPFKASSQTVNAQNSVTDTDGIVKGITDTTNETLAKSLTHGTSIAKTHTDSVGGSVGVNAGISASVNYNHAYSRTRAESTANTDTKSMGTAKSLTEQNSVAKSLTTTNGESIQINYENRAVKTLLDRIDEQIIRMRACEDFGMFDSCAYFIAKDYDVAIAAASAFKSLTRGENSSAESSAVNVWENTEDVEYIKDYLMRFYHPEFLTMIDKEHHYSTTAAMLISGKEMAYQMALPKKSVAGVPVVECAEFGREIVSLSGDEGDITIGQIFHMHSEEPSSVELNAKSMTAHTFITGSTGSRINNDI